MKSKLLQSFPTKASFFPYQNKTKVAYFAYLGLCTVLFLAVFAFSLFATLNVGKYKLYDLKLEDFTFNKLNLFYAPILCLAVVSISMVLLILAPKVTIKAKRCSNRMFYTSFWLLILSVMLSSEIQITYISHSEILDSPYYHWLKPVVARIFIIFVIFLILVLQVFFWIMRRKFTGFPSDYEIYTNRSINKKQQKLKKQEIKKIKKQQ